MNERELIERSIALLQRRRDSAKQDPVRDFPKSLGEWLKNPELLIEPPSLIPRIALSGRSTLLAAREKTGKSTLLAQAVAALTTGSSFLEQDLLRTTVLWYCLDEPISDCVRRFEALGGDPESLVISTERPTASEMQAEAESVGAALVVVDTLTELWRGMIRSEKDADDVAGFLDPYIRLLRESNIALVFSHHTPKSGSDYRGSGAIGAKVDLILLLRRPTTASRADDVSEREGEPQIDDGQRILEGRGRGVPHFVHRLSFANQRYSSGEASLSLRDRILAALSQRADTTRGIRERVRGKYQRISETITQMDEEGAINKVGGLWTLVDCGSSANLPPMTELSSKGRGASPIPSGTAEEQGRNSLGTTAHEHLVRAVPTATFTTETQEPDELRSPNSTIGTSLKENVA